MSLGVLLLLDAGVGFLDQPHTRGTAKCRTRSPKALVVSRCYSPGVPRRSSGPPSVFTMECTGAATIYAFISVVSLSLGGKFCEPR